MRVLHCSLDLRHVLLHIGNRLLQERHHSVEAFRSLELQGKGFRHEFMKPVFLGCPKDGGPKGGGPNISRFFFSPLPPLFSFFFFLSLSGCLLVSFFLSLHSFFSLWEFSRGILVVFEAPGRSCVHVWSSLVVVWSPGGPEAAFQRLLCFGEVVLHIHRLDFFFLRQ